MAATNTSSESGLASSMDSITGEAKRVIEQEFSVLRGELKKELAEGRDAVLDLGSGAALGALSGVLLSLMLVHLLQRTTGMPLWLSYGIVGGAMAFTGSGLLAVGADQAGKAGAAIKESLAGS